MCELIAGSNASFDHMVWEDARKAAWLRNATAHHGPQSICTSWCATSSPPFSYRVSARMSVSPA